MVYAIRGDAIRHGGGDEEGYASAAIRARQAGRHFFSAFQVSQKYVKKREMKRKHWRREEFNDFFRMRDNVVFFIDL